MGPMIPREMKYNLQYDEVVYVNVLILEIYTKN